MSLPSESLLVRDDAFPTIEFRNHGVQRNDDDGGGDDDRGAKINGCRSRSCEGDDEDSDR